MLVLAELVGGLRNLRSGLTREYLDLDVNEDPIEFKRWEVANEVANERRQLEANIEMEKGKKESYGSERF